MNETKYEARRRMPNEVIALEKEKKKIASIVT